MTASYSGALIARIRAATERGLGEELALVCIGAGLPAVYVAQVLGVTRMTLHTWFRGGNVSLRKREKVERFIRIIKEDLSDGTLPAKSVRAARSYLQTLCSEPLKATTVKQIDG